MLKKLFTIFMVCVLITGASILPSITLKPESSALAAASTFADLYKLLGVSTPPTASIENSGVYVLVPYTTILDSNMTAPVLTGGVYQTGLIMTPNVVAISLIGFRVCGNTGMYLATKNSGQPLSATEMSNYGLWISGGTGTQSDPYWVLGL